MQETSGARRHVQISKIRPAQKHDGQERHQFQVRLQGPG